MEAMPQELEKRLRHHGQEHVLAGWARLSDAERRALVDQVRCIDLDQLRQLYADRDQTFSLPPAEAIAPIPVMRMDEGTPEVKQLGEAALRRGEVATLVVAGGQGSRLGF